MAEHLRLDLGSEIAELAKDLVVRRRDGRRVRRRVGRRYGLGPLGERRPERLAQLEPRPERAQLEIALLTNLARCTDLPAEGRRCRPGWGHRSPVDEDGGARARARRRRRRSDDRPLPCAAPLALGSGVTGVAEGATVGRWAAATVGRWADETVS